jgi:hypothetical protein
VVARGQVIPVLPGSPLYQSIVGGEAAIRDVLHRSSQLFYTIYHGKSRNHFFGQILIKLADSVYIRKMGIPLFYLILK